MNKYKVAFILPQDTKCNLGDDGWDFESEKRITSEVEKILDENFQTVESNLNSKSYEISGVKIDVFRDEKNQIESVFFRYYQGNPELPSCLMSVVNSNRLQFFVPK